MTDTHPGLGAPFHVGLAVPHLETAMDELRRSLGVAWHATVERPIDALGLLRIAVSRGGEPYLELTEAPAGSLWEATDGASLHHLGYWVADMHSATQALDAAGMTIVADFGHARYFEGTASGLRLELVETSFREQLEARYFTS